jgi:hypothetical protein
MANGKANPRNQSSKSDQPQHTADATPNPQGQQTVIEMPLRPDQRKVTQQNVAQNPSTVGNRMNPSVTVSPENVIEPDRQFDDTDSMFNNADPQTRDLVEENNAPNRLHLQRGARGRKKTA